MSIEVILSLSILITILIVIGIVEFNHHQIVLSKLPIRIHINGSRGKSSVTRLVAAGLRAGGLKTLAKTTGSAPRIIDENGKDQIIHRLRSASIGEQVKLLRNFSRKKPDAVVIECMAVQPQYQWVAEQKMVKSTISVITNVRPDHLDEMGSTMTDIALSMGNTIPSNGTLVAAEHDVLQPLIDVAKTRNSTVEEVFPDKITEEYIDRFPFLEHPENVALAVKVCEMAGVEEKTALEGMVYTQPDPGALVVWNLKFDKIINHFVSAFAANDPKSTLQIWNLFHNRIHENPSCIFLNTRGDRRYRTHQLIDLVYKYINPNRLIIRGDNLPPFLDDLMKNNPEIIVEIFPESTDPKTIIDSFSKLDNHFIMGIGNIVGWGDEFLSDLKRYRS